MLADDEPLNPTESGHPALVLISESDVLETSWRSWLEPWWQGHLYRCRSPEDAVPILQQFSSLIILLETDCPEHASRTLNHLRKHCPIAPSVLLLKEPPDQRWQALLTDPCNDHILSSGACETTLHRVLRYCSNLLQCHDRLRKLEQLQHLQNPEPTSSYNPELWRALQREEFVLFYQPRIDLHEGSICGAEALIRWQHPKRGLLTPDHFIPDCEASGLVVPLGYWVIQQVGKSLPNMLASGLKGRIGVNLSFRQFQDRFLATTIERLIKQHLIDTRTLEFELTETALCSDEEHVRESITQLSALGVEFSLDDFGTGYSSFSLLQKLPVATLKIDKSFIAGIPGNTDDEEIVRAMISLAHNLNKQVIAEGVENREQLEFLIRHECDQVQGYFFSRPICEEQFLTLLSRSQRQQAP
ncbi:putative bifunctional diguanylate cyclase/phosphodiesterase [Marinobacterium iners]|uniref:EAL domain, c-di-GMP-specific phosphodiesterase class I (Or its enzymatically inactive variant) n=1 Tax=Marinobacterium iners DSM 11526 TaxID=1122198 RepID=A0A1H4DIB9_9GAMM|nr:EAL domain-containing protein [Marinobacterium iners]SEA72531.1 EAL domain, c-di-GMP-specific phosphodiesterase class I (or its enzymatically inactive variant) [Marinobacterium iners DSM 11526]